MVDYVESAPAPSRAPEARAKPYLDARKIEERFQMVADQLNEISRIMALRTERLAVKIKLLEERQANFIEDFQKRLTSLTTKALSGARVDVKVAELIEKHNQVVRTFENRLSQLKRVVENQEIELYKAANELQEARKELAKLKRG
ncbi:MAG TPA: hypothetical protein VFV50_16005 [Bdellovibrionales bacterium]|nr:hypothetical protein [Bdellovibrionales bacterium]